MTTTTVYTAAWTGETILPDTQETQLARTADDYGGCPLPRDGLPRITAEGITILAEGLRGDFHRWRWSIGNHPLELPCEHVSNLRIAAMKDEPHYVAHAYTGKEFPLTYHNMVMVPWFVFDELDTNITKYHTGPHVSITLGSTADHWARLTILVDDNEPAAKAGRTSDEDEEDDGMADCPIRAPKASAACSLDQWMGGKA